MSRIQAVDTDGHHLAWVHEGYVPGAIARGEAAPTDDPRIIVLRPSALERFKAPGLTPQQLRAKHLAEEKARNERRRR